MKISHKPRLFLGVLLFLAVLGFFLFIYGSFLNSCEKEEPKVDLVEQKIDSIVKKSIQGSFFARSIPILLPEKKDTIIIEKNGSLCRSLKMTENQALEFAERYNLKHYYRSNGQLIVIVQPSDTFLRDWRPLNFSL